MPLSPDDAYVLLEALRTSLREAGYADAADQILRVTNEALHPDELDDPSDADAPAWSALERFNDHELESAPVDEMLTEPTPGQRLSAAVKIVDLMVVEPLWMEQHVPVISRRAGLRGVEMRIGEGEAQLVLPAQLSNASGAALQSWTDVLADLRQVLADAEADDR
jgi:hypothetical protein